MVQSLARRHGLEFQLFAAFIIGFRSGCVGCHALVFIPTRRRSSLFHFNRKGRLILLYANARLLLRRRRQLVLYLLMLL